MADAIFAGLGQALTADPALGKKVGGSLRFKLATAGGKGAAWLVDCAAGRVSNDEESKADCTITMKEADFVALANGKLNGVQAYMTGRMKITGKTPLAQKFGALAAAARKSAKTAAAPADTTASTAAAAAAPTAAPAAAAATPPPTGFESNAVFASIAANLRADASLLKKVNGRLHIRVTNAGGQAATWTIDAKTGGTGAVSAAADGTADCTITIGDSDLVALAAGKANGMALYMRGKMKVKGKAALAQKLAALFQTAPRSKL